MQRVDKKFPFKSVFALTVAIVFYFNLFLSLSLSVLLVSLFAKKEGIFEPATFHLRG